MDYTITVNPYDIPEVVLRLISSVSSARDNSNIGNYWNPIIVVLNGVNEGDENSLRKYYYENRHDFYNRDFLYDLVELCKSLSFDIQTRENTSHTQIAVAGGFDSGKSSFINRITGFNGLLPTGIEPVSVVPTFLYCSKNNRELQIRGVNLKNAVVSLDEGVLSAIQHSSSSNIYIASVIDKLFVELPSEELDGIAFVDTPGYNNSDTENSFNGKTDKQSALEGMQEGNFLLWLVGISKGGMRKEDIEMLASFNGKKAIMFSKADMMPLDDVEVIVDETWEELSEEFGDSLVDVFAYSALDNRLYYSANNYNLNDILEIAKQEGNASAQNILIEKIEQLFDLEIQVAKNTIEEREKAQNEMVSKTEEIHGIYSQNKENNAEFLEDLKECLINSYSSIVENVNNFRECASNAIDGWQQMINDAQSYCNSHFNVGDLERDASYGRNKVRSCIDSYNSHLNDSSYYKEEYREQLYGKSEHMVGFLEGILKEEYENCSERASANLEYINLQKKLIKQFSKFKTKFMQAVKLGIREYKKRQNILQVDTSFNCKISIFDAIDADDYTSFLLCFSDGVDCKNFNREGYSPFTYAVRSGNNAMVKFFLEKGANASWKDGRGKNALHTAIENQFRDICELILKYSDNDILKTKTDVGEDIYSLLKTNQFETWINNL